MIFNDLHFTAVTWLPRIALLPFLRCLILLHFHQSFTFPIDSPIPTLKWMPVSQPILPVNTLRHRDGHLEGKTPWGFNSERLALLAYGRQRWLGWHSAHHDMVGGRHQGEGQRHRWMSKSVATTGVENFPKSTSVDFCWVVLKGASHL